MKLVYICSPWKAETLDERKRNLTIAVSMCRKAVKRGYIPIAPHLFYSYPEVLREEIPMERELGIGLGLRLLEICSEMWVYSGVSPTYGMSREIERAKELDIPIYKINPFEGVYDD